MHLIGLGTAVPATRYSQEECWHAVRATPRFGRLSPAARGLLERVLLGDNGIRTRHLALGRLAEAFELDADVLHERYREHAPALAERAARRALERAGVAVGEIDALLISTCTGYLCPGLTSYVGERLGLRADALGLDFVGQGCGAALPNLRTGEALIAARRASNVLSIAVEVCSAALYIDNDPGVLVSACLFGDGAGAAVLSATPRPDVRSVEWISAFSLSNPKEREALRMESREGMLRNLLSRSVPAVAARHASELLERALERREMEKDRIAAWILHAGGRPVLDRLRDALGLDEADVRLSRDALSRYGNLSSPFVLFVLEAALRDEAPGGYWWMSSFGAGFSCHGALLKVASD